MIDEIAPIECSAGSHTFTLLAQDTAGFLGHGGLGTQEGGSRVLVSRQTHKSESVLPKNVPSIL
jgi:hypothetical protein